MLFYRNYFNSTLFSPSFSKYKKAILKKKYRNFKNKFIKNNPIKNKFIKNNPIRSKFMRNQFRGKKFIRNKFMRNQFRGKKFRKNKFIANKLRKNNPKRNKPMKNNSMKKGFLSTKSKTQKIFSLNSLKIVNLKSDQNSNKFKNLLYKQRFHEQRAFATNKYPRNQTLKKNQRTEKNLNNQLNKFNSTTNQFYKKRINWGAIKSKFDKNSKQPMTTINKRYFNTKINILIPQKKLKKKLAIIKRVTNSKLKNILSKQHKFVGNPIFIDFKLIRKYRKKKSMKNQSILKIKLRTLKLLKKKLKEKIKIFKKLRLLDKTTILTAYKVLIKHKIKIILKLVKLKSSILNIYLKWKISNISISKLQKYILHCKIKSYLNLVKKFNLIGFLFLKQILLKVKTKKNLTFNKVKKTFNFNKVMLKKKKLNFLHNFYLNLFVPRFKSRKLKIKWTHRELKYIKEFKIPFLPKYLRKNILRSRYFPFKRIALRTIRNFYYKNTMFRKYIRFNTVKPNSLLNKQFFVNSFNFLTNFQKLVKKLKLLTKNCLFKRLFGLTVLNLIYLRINNNANITFKKNYVNSSYFNIVNSIKNPIIHFLKIYTKIYYINKPFNHIKYINSNYIKKFFYKKKNLKKNNYFKKKHYLKKKNHVKKKNYFKTAKRTKNITLVKQFYPNFGLKLLINLVNKTYYSKILLSYISINKLFTLKFSNNLLNFKVNNLLIFYLMRFRTQNIKSYYNHKRKKLIDIYHKFFFKLTTYKLQSFINYNLKRFLIKKPSLLNILFLIHKLKLNKKKRKFTYFYKFRKASVKFNIKFLKLISNRRINFIKFNLHKSKKMLYRARTKFAYSWCGKYSISTPVKFFKMFKPNSRFFRNLITNLTSIEFLKYIFFVQTVAKDKFYSNITQYYKKNNIKKIGSKIETQMKSFQNKLENLTNVEKFLKVKLEKVEYPLKKTKLKKVKKKLNKFPFKKFKSALFHKLISKKKLILENLKLDYFKFSNNVNLKSSILEEFEKEQAELVKKKERKQGLQGRKTNNIFQDFQNAVKEQNLIHLDFFKYNYNESLSKNLKQYKSCIKNFKYRERKKNKQQNIFVKKKMND